MKELASPKRSAKLSHQGRLGSSVRYKEGGWWKTHSPFSRHYQCLRTLGNVGRQASKGMWAHGGRGGKEWQHPHYEKTTFAEKLLTEKGTVVSNRIFTDIQKSPETSKWSHRSVPLLTLHSACLFITLTIFSLVSVTWILVNGEAVNYGLMDFISFFFSFWDGVQMTKSFLFQWLLSYKVYLWVISKLAQGRNGSKLNWWRFTFWN